MGQVLSSCKHHIFHNQRLRPVNKLELNQSNQVVSIKDILQNYQGYIGNQHALYVPYNYMYKDLGWGCAWRAIQMVLSAYGIQQDFRQLFFKYSHKQILMDIIKNHKLYDQKVVKILQASKFAPEDASNNWAQPFICKLVCIDKNINCKLSLINGYPYANAPKEVFQHKYSFKQFLHKVQENISHSPIMIDDGSLAMAILAYKKISQNQHGFIIGDPHVISNRQNKKVGIYQIIFDNEGRQLRNTVDKNILCQAYLDSITYTYFKDKDWMVLFTSDLKRNNKL